MAQQDQLGPFSEYLTKPAAAAMAPIPVPQPTGLEGTGSSIGHIALNFINGLRQGRIQKYAMQEAEHQKDIARYQHALQVIGASGLPEDQKRLYEAKLTTPLIQNIAADKRATSKETGHPMTNVFKHMATSIVGGNLPKHGEKLSMEPVMEAIMAASDPARQKTKLLSDLRDQMGKRFRQLKQEAGANPLTDAQVTADEAMFALDNEMIKLGGPGASALKTFTSATTSPITASGYLAQQRYEQIKKEQDEAREILNSDLPDNILSPDEMQRHKLAAGALKMPQAVKTGMPEQLADSNGNLVVGFSFTHPNPKHSGYYDAKTYKKLEGITKATPYQIKRGSPENINKDIQSAKSSISSLFDSQSPEQASIANVYSEQLLRAKDPDTINKIVSEALRQKTAFIRRDYAKTRDDKQYQLQVGKAIEALPSKKQLNQVSGLYSQILAQENDDNIQKDPDKKALFQRVLINFVSKAADPDSVVRENELKYWGTQKIGAARAAFLIDNIFKGTQAALTDDEQMALLDVAHGMYDAINKKTQNQEADFRKNIGVTPASKVTITPPPLVTPTPPSEGRTKFNPSAAGGFNPGAGGKK